MNAMQLQDAIGEIRDCYILAAHSEQIRHIPIQKSGLLFSLRQQSWR